MSFQHQLTLGLNFDYAGHEAFSALTNDVRAADGQGKSFAKTYQEAARAEEELAKKTTEAAKAVKAASGMNPLKSLAAGIWSGAAGSLGPLGSLFTSAGTLGFAGIGALIGDAIADAIRYQHAVVDISLASERAAGKSKELYSSTLKVADGLRISAMEAAELGKLTETFKVSTNFIETFTNSTEKMSQTLGLSRDEAAAFNYELTRIPGFSGPLEAMGGTLKKLTDNFRVSAQELITGVSGSEDLLFEVLPKFRTKAAEELAIATARWKDLGAPDRLMNDIMLAFSQFKWDPKKNILAMAGISVESARQMIARGDITKLSEMTISALLDDMKRINISGRQEIGASLLGIDAPTVMRIAMRAQTAAKDVGSKVVEAASAGPTYMEKRWLDTFDSIQKSSTALGNKLQSMEIQALAPAITSLADSLKILQDTIYSPRPLSSISTAGLESILTTAGIAGASGLLALAAAGGPISAGLIGISAGAALAIFGLIKLDAYQDRAFRRGHREWANALDRKNEAMTDLALGEMPGAAYTYNTLVSRQSALNKSGQPDMSVVYQAMADSYREWKEKHDHAAWLDVERSNANASRFDMEATRTPEVIDGHAVPGHGDGALVLPRVNGTYLNRPVAERGEPEAVVPLSKLGDYAFSDKNAERICESLFQLGEKLITNLKQKQPMLVPRRALTDGDRATQHYRS